MTTPPKGFYTNFPDEDLFVHFRFLGSQLDNFPWDNWRTKEIEDIDHQRFLIGEEIDRRSTQSGHERLNEARMYKHAPSTITPAHTYEGKIE